MSVWFQRERKGNNKANITSQMTLLGISQRLKPLILLICKIVNANGFLPLWKLMHRKKNFNELPGQCAYRYLSNVCHLSYRWGIIKKVRRKERQYLYKHFHAKMAQFSSCHNFIVSESQESLTLSLAGPVQLHHSDLEESGLKTARWFCKQHLLLNLFLKMELPTFKNMWQQTIWINCFTPGRSRIY